jgi:hypothetical protein
MEYIQKWAKVDRLQSLQTLFRTMNKLSGIRSSETWIESRINALRFDASLQQADEPPDVPCAPVQRDIVMQIFTRTCTRLRRGTAEHSAMLSAQALEIWDRPGYREKQGASSAALWQSAEYREKTVSALVKGQQRRCADPKDEASREAAGNKRMFKRSDDPKAKEKWNSFVAKAEKWASELPQAELGVQFHNSFITLHLDGRQYGYRKASTTPRASTRSHPPPSLTDTQRARLQSAFFEKTSSDSGPFLTTGDVKALAGEINLSAKEIRERLGKVRDQWLRAAAVLRLKGVVVDYANIDHLAWMA